jgi:hypothetical protein
MDWWLRPFAFVALIVFRSVDNLHRIPRARQFGFAQRVAVTCAAVDC